MSAIKYVQGDATSPIGPGNKFIVHVCNDIGAWGAGFVLAISRRWDEPEAMYRKWFRVDHDFKLGRIQRVQVEEDITVVNMIAQNGVGVNARGNIPLRYTMVAECLRKVAKRASEVGASVHMPRIGCGLAGGSWPAIEKIIEDTLLAVNLEVVVYDFE